MLIFLFYYSSSIEYSLSANDMTISGEGIITKEGVRSKGLYNKITSIIIKDGPTEISDKSFEDCFSLNYLYISKTVIDIGGFAFRFCNSLKNIEVHPDNEYLCNDDQSILYSKDKKILYRAPISSGLKIPEGVEQIVANSFQACDFGSVVFPNSVKVLEFQTFDCGTFSTLSFASPSKLTILYGFAYSSIGTLIVPNTVTYIKDDAFYRATVRTISFEENSKLEKLCKMSMEFLNIEELSFPNSLKIIESEAFTESTVKKISIGSECTDISIDAFSGCKMLKDIVIDNGNSKYSSYEGVLMDKNHQEIMFIPNGKETIVIESNVTKIGKTSLQNSVQLTTIQLQGNNKWGTKDGVLYSSNYKTLIAVCGGVTTVSVDERVETIEEFAAFECKNLSTITFSGNSVSSINLKAFYSSGIQSFTLPNSVTSISNYAFSGTSSLKTFQVNTESSLKTIGYQSFYSSALNSFYFGKSVTFINSQAFWLCKNLVTITFHEDISITELGFLAFRETGVKDVLLPSSLNNINDNCFELANVEHLKFKEGSALQSIGDRAFYGCTSLIDVSLPDSCKSVGVEAFCNCKSLVTITHKLEIINTIAFKDCTKLENFNFSAGQTELDPSVFMNCVNIISYSVDAGNQKLTAISGCVFNSEGTILYLFPPGQETAVIPSKTIKFADNAFAWSPKLRFVAFYSDSNLTTIGNSAFYECINLEAVRFPPKLAHISERSFYGCSSLGYIIFPDSLMTIGSNAFINCNKVRVHYCGTNFIDGESVFNSNIEVFVTDLYPKDTFCSNVAAKKLSFNCDMKPEFVKASCKVGFNFPNILALYSILILVNV